MNTDNSEYVNRILPKQMKKAMFRSGYLLEQRIESVLSKSDYIVETNQVFPYPDSGISGEFDIEAGKLFPIFKSTQWMSGIYLDLLIECKNNPQPIVFFCKEIDQPFLQGMDVKISGIPVQFKVSEIPFPLNKQDEYVSLAEFVNIDRFHHHCSGVVSTQWCTFQKKKKSKEWMAFHSDEQHNMFSSLINALEYLTADHYSAWSPTQPYSGEVDINIYYPLTVLQGELYSARLENGGLSQHKENLVHFCKENYSPQSNKITTYHFDVIREAYFSDYLKMIELEITKIRNSMRSQKKKVLASIEALTKNARKLKNSPESYRDILEF